MRTIGIMDEWEGLDGVKIGGAGGENEESHAHTRTEEQEEQDSKHEKVQAAPLVERLLVSKNIPEYMRKDGEASARATMEREREWGREKRERASGDERTRRGAGDGGETKVG